MIVVRSPLRITLGCGGTDLPSYCSKHGGFNITAAIDKYVYVAVTRPFEPGIIVKYSKEERVQTVDEVGHTLIREALRYTGVDRAEITTLADIPGGTGLGSSSSITTAALLALSTYTRQSMGKAELAEAACAIEIAKLGAPIGRQDQYAAAYGGVQYLTFHTNGTVTVMPNRLPKETLVDLEENLMLFYTGQRRSTSEVLSEPPDETFLNEAQAITRLMQEALERGQTWHFAQLMACCWQWKQRYASTPEIDSWYELAIANGAVGGKLVGAGKGGFLLFYAEGRRRLRKAMTSAGLEEVRFGFDWDGTKVVLS